jgi:hypothetical protein
VVNVSSKGLELFLTKVFVENVYYDHIKLDSQSGKNKLECDYGKKETSQLSRKHK